MSVVASFKKYSIYPIVALIAFAPIIDVLSMLTQGFPVSFSAIVRLLGLLAMFVRLMLSTKTKERKRSLIYLAVLTVFFGIQLGVNLSQIADIRSAYQMFRTWFFPLTILMIQGGEKISRPLILKALIVCIAGYSVSILIAILSGTSLTTYSAGTGAVGWYYAGNEIGAIIAILSGLIVAWRFRVGGGKIPSLLATLALFLAPTINTKTAVFGTIGVLLMSTLMLLHRKTGGLKRIGALVACWMALVLGFLFAPFLQRISQSSVSAATYQSGTSALYRVCVSGESILSPLAENAMSGRCYYLEDGYQRFSNSSILTQLFGTYSYYNEDLTKTTEIDVFDVLFSNGIIGFLLFIWIVGKAIVGALRTKMPEGDDERAILGAMKIGIVAAIALAFTAGHVLVAPSVSVIVAAMIYYVSSSRPSRLATGSFQG